MILSILDADIVIDEASYVVGVDVDPDYLDIDVGVSLNYSQILTLVEGAFGNVFVKELALISAVRHFK